MKLHNRGLRIVLCLASVSLFFPLTPLLSASAAPYTCSTSQGGFEGYGGYTSPPTTVHNTPVGVSGRIVSSTLSFCTIGRPDDLFASSWVMLDDQSGTRGLAQTGLIREGGAGHPDNGCMTPFFEYHHDASSGFAPPAGQRYDYPDTCVPDNTLYTFYVLRVSDANGNHLHLGIGSGTVAGPIYTTTWTTDTWRVIAPLYSSEVNRAGADIPGRPSSPAIFRDLGIQSADGSGLIPVPCYLNQVSTAPRGHSAANNCQLFFTWTDPLY